jgi:hypothetical protein
MYNAKYLQLIQGFDNLKSDSKIREEDIDGKT